MIEEQIQNGCMQDYDRSEKGYVHRFERLGHMIGKIGPGSDKFYSEVKYSEDV